MQSQSAATAKDSLVSRNTDSPNNQRLAQKRLLEASLFGDEEEEEGDTPMSKKSKLKEAEDLTQMKDKIKTDKKQDGAESKAPKQSLEVNGNSRRSSSKTPEPMSSTHVDDSGKSSKHNHSKQSSSGRQHHSHSKQHRSSHHSSSATSTKQTMSPLSDGKSAAPASTKKDETPSVSEAVEKRTVSPLKLSKLPSSSAATQNHNTSYAVDMKILFGDDDDDDVETTDTVAAAVTSVVTKDDGQHKADHIKPSAEKAKKQSLHGHKKTPEKAHSSKAHTPPVAKSRSDRNDVHPSKANSSLSSSYSSDKHRRQPSESAVDKKLRDAAKSCSKTMAVATKPVSSAPAVTGSKPSMTDSVAKSSKVSHAVSSKKKRGAESGACENDLSLSDSDASDSGESNDVDVCDSQPEKPPSSTENTQRQSDTQLPSLSQEAKAANGEYVTVLLDLQKQLMSVVDDETLEKLTTLVEETGKYSITTDSFDFDLCQLDIHTVNKLKHFLATVAY